MYRFLIFLWISMMACVVMCCIGGHYGAALVLSFLSIFVGIGVSIKGLFK
jgi:hypothetical protein